MPTWKIEYNNDTGPNDEGFWEWWEVTDGTRSFRCENESDADWLCCNLNIILQNQVLKTMRQL